MFTSFGALLFVCAHFFSLLLRTLSIILWFAFAYRLFRSFRSIIFGIARRQLSFYGFLFCCRCWLQFICSHCILIYSPFDAAATTTTTKTAATAAATEKKKCRTGKSGTDEQSKTVNNTKSVELLLRWNYTWNERKMACVCVRLAGRSVSVTVLRAATQLMPHMWHKLKP